MKIQIDNLLLHKRNDFRNNCRVSLPRKVSDLYRSEQPRTIFDQNQSLKEDLMILDLLSTFFLDIHWSLLYDVETILNDFLPQIPRLSTRLSYQYILLHSIFQRSIIDNAMRGKDWPKILHFIELCFLMFYQPLA